VATAHSTAPAVDRVTQLLTPEAAERASVSTGYLDLLGPGAPPSSGRVQDLMLSRALPQIYERWWRPALGRTAKGVLGPGMADEVRIARLLMALGPGDTVLDLACGTGNFTRRFAHAVSTEGLVVGIDVSETMLRRAAGDTERAGLSREVGYVRGDAEALPFVDGSFDAVCCFAALNLFADPWRALDSATAVLRPGGRIAIFTSVRGRSPLLRAGEAVLQAQSGMTMFERHEVVDALHARGFGEVRQRLTGVTQFVGGRLEG